MALRFVIQEVNIETVKKPGNAKGYQVATIAHSYNGRAQTQKVLSFANPEVFKQATYLKAGDVVDVDITKNDAGYNQWAKLTQVRGEETVEQDDNVDKASPIPSKASTGFAPVSGKVIGSNYETREERAARQVLIVRQSCLAQSVALWGQGGALDAVLDTAQRFVDWVFEKPDLFDQPNDLETSD